MVPRQAARDEQGDRRQEERRGRDFAGAPVFTPDGVASEACFARAVREPRGDRALVVTTSHGPPGAAATTITHRRRPAASALRLVLDNDAGDCPSALEELLMLPELRDAVLQWLPCCDLCRARRVSRRLFVWAGDALAVQRSPALVGNAKRDYAGLEFMQQLDPRSLAFKLVGPAAPSSSATAPTADDCAQRGDQLFALRGSALFATQLPELGARKQECAPPSPAVEQVSSPERTPRGVDLLTPQKVGVDDEVVGTPASPEHLKAPADLLWDEVLRIPKAGVGQHGRERAFERLRVGGRLCVDHDGALLLIGGGVEQTAAEPPLVMREQLDNDGEVRAADEAAPAATTVLGVTAQVLRVDPSTGLWQRLPDLLEVRRDCVVAMLPNGAILVAGGAGMHGALSSAEILGPDVSGGRTSTRTCTPTCAYISPRAYL